MHLFNPTNNEMLREVAIEAVWRHTFRMGEFEMFGAIFCVENSSVRPISVPTYWLSIDCDRHTGQISVGFTSNAANEREGWTYYFPFNL